MIDHFYASAIEFQLFRPPSANGMLVRMADTHEAKDVAKFGYPGNRSSVLGFHFYPIKDGRQHDVADSLRLRVRSGVKLKTDTSIPHDENFMPEKTSSSIDSARWKGGNRRHQLGCCCSGFLNSAGSAIVRT